MLLYTGLMETFMLFSHVSFSKTAANYPIDVIGLFEI